MTSLEDLQPALSDLLSAAQDQLPEIVALRRRIHQEPELGLELPLTQAAVLESLDGLGLEVSIGTGLSSVVADLDTGRAGPTILLRGDMDALPMHEDTGVEFKSRHDDRMHSCGHDAHTAMLVGAAKLLVDNRVDLCGRVRFMFQPGEEHDGGAALMIDEGVLDGVDAAFAIHVAPNLFPGLIASRPGPLLAAADEFHIRIIGKGGHASTPHWATDPIPVACEIVTALQAMITRSVDAFNPAVLTVAQISAGTTHNVIPETARLSGTLRTVDESVRHDVWTSIKRVAEGVASAHGCDVEVNIAEGYPVTTNNQGFVEFAQKATEAAIGQGKFFQIPAPVMGAEDFSYVLNRIPGAMVFLGACPAENPDPFSAPSCHSNRMILDEPSMAAGIAVHAAVAVAFGNGAD